MLRNILLQVPIQLPPSQMEKWKDTAPVKINRLIPILIYFGVVKVGTHNDRYWSTESLYNASGQNQSCPELNIELLWPCYMLVLQELTQKK